MAKFSSLFLQKKTPVNENFVQVILGDWDPYVVKVVQSQNVIALFWQLKMKSMTSLLDS